jgi:hypothetical protein
MAKLAMTVKAIRAKEKLFRVYTRSMLKYSLNTLSAILPLTGDEKIPPDMVHASACIDLFSTSSERKADNNQRDAN